MSSEEKTVVKAFLILVAFVNFFTGSDPNRDKSFSARKFMLECLQYQTTTNCEDSLETYMQIKYGDE